MDGWIMQDTVSQYAGAAKDKLVGAKNSAQDTLEQSKQSASETAENVKDAAQNKYNQAADYTNDTAQRTKNVAADTYNQATESAGKTAADTQRGTQERYFISRTIISIFSKTLWRLFLFVIWWMNHSFEWCSIILASIPVNYPIKPMMSPETWTNCRVVKVSSYLSTDCKVMRLASFVWSLSGF